MEQYEKDTKKREFDSETAKDIDKAFRARHLRCTVELIVYHVMNRKIYKKPCDVKRFGEYSYVFDSRLVGFRDSIKRVGSQQFI